MATEKRQSKSEKARARRRELVAALNQAARSASGLGGLFAQQVAARLGINVTDLECIEMIATPGTLTAGELAAKTGLTSGAVTGIVDRLERAGFVTRERDRQDRRKVHVRIVPEGAERAGGYYRSLGAAVDGLLDPYDEEQIAFLVDYFTRTREVLLDEIEKLSETGAVNGVAAGGEQRRTE
jgi:DNA-binding MarR family transcriptional regulator